MRKLWIIPLGLVLVLAALWLARAKLAGELAQNYFSSHGVASSVSFGRFGLSGISGRIALGPQGNPDFSADAVEVDFDPLRFMPRIVEVRLVRPVVRARVTPDGKLVLPSLQAWLDSLGASQGSSDYVSDELTVSLSNLRALLATPAGPLDLNGDVLLRHGRLVAANLRARPVALSWQGYQVRLASADMRLFPSRSDYGLTLRFNGAVQAQGFAAQGMTAQLSGGALHWDQSAKSFSTPRLQLHLTAASLSSGALSAAQPVVDLVAQNVAASLSAGKLSAKAQLQLHGGADFAPVAWAKKFPVLAKDARLPLALENNLQHLDIAAAAAVTAQDGAFDMALTAPAQIRGAKGGALKLASLSLKGGPKALAGAFDLSLSGAGLPAVSLSARQLTFANGAVNTDLAFKAHFDFAMLHGAAASGRGKASFQDGIFTFDLGPCAAATLAAFHPGDTDMARLVKGAFCAAPGENMLRADASGWRFAGLARDASMFVPLGTLKFDGGAGHVGFSGQGDVVDGLVQVTAAKMSDGAPVTRFAPMLGSGQITLKNWVWQGDFAATDAGRIALGTASFSHTLANGSGQMLIHASGLQFAEGKLQPAMLSPLLGAVARAQGKAGFEGELDWTKAGFTSHGALTLDALDFLTPLGTAHAINAKIALSSLLPPATAPAQHIVISRIDWTLPLSGIAMDFSFGGSTLKLDGFSTNIAEGSVRLGALSLDLAGPRAVKGAAELKSISLAPLVAASNLASKIKLEGKVTGNVPFTYGPEGFRVVNGHLAADGPGRISLDRSVWNQGGAVAVNAVQDLAYQAMENLAFDQMSADINSIPGGRLQVVFHIKGRSDPPKRQEAKIAVQDIVNGSALQKPIDLPSGTPIDLTLDTSLNFDELLNSYSEAWSKTLGR